MSRCVCGRKQFNSSVLGNPIIAVCDTCLDADWVISCSCGGDLEPIHELGAEVCLREMAFPQPRKISGDNDRWFVDGYVITGFTMREQRGYYQHGEGGKWSRPKDHESTNSIPDET